MSAADLLVMRAAKDAAAADVRRVYPFPVSRSFPLLPYPYAVTFDHFFFNFLPFHVTHSLLSHASEFRDSVNEFPSFS